MFTTPTPLISWTEKGLYCEAGGFYIDPHRAVDLAICTHAHSDHARRGSKKYLCALSGVGLLRSRLGKNIQVEGIAFGKTVTLGEVQVSLHPAGHILGSAQVRVQRGAEIWVATGDYKRDPDPSCEPFESVTCDTLITEATFGTPKYVWNKSVRHGPEIAAWWRANSGRGENSILFGYSLGKGQRILAELAPYAEKPVLIHSSMVDLTECYRAEGRVLAPTTPLEQVLEDSIKRDVELKNELILAPPFIMDQEWISRLGRFRTAFASGWMQGGANRDYDHGFVMSDHADWSDLNQSILESKAQRVFVQHRNGVLVRHLRAQGIEAHSADFLTPEKYARLPVTTMDLFRE